MSRSAIRSIRATWPRMKTISRVSEKAVRKELANNTKKLEEIAASGQALRDDIFKILDHFVSSSRAQFEQIKHLIEGNGRELRKTLDEKLKAIAVENAKQLQRLGEALIHAAGGNEKP